MEGGEQVKNDENVNANSGVASELLKSPEKSAEEQGKAADEVQKKASDEKIESAEREETQKKSKRSRRPPKSFLIESEHREEQEEIHKRWRKFGGSISSSLPLSNKQKHELMIEPRLATIPKPQLNATPEEIRKMLQSSNLHKKWTKAMDRTKARNKRRLEILKEIERELQNYPEKASDKLSKGAVAPLSCYFFLPPALTNKEVADLRQISYNNQDLQQSTIGNGESRLIECVTEKGQGKVEMCYFPQEILSLDVFEFQTLLKSAWNSPSLQRSDREFLFSLVPSLNVAPSNNNAGIIKESPIKNRYFETDNAMKAKKLSAGSPFEIIISPQMNDTEIERKWREKIIGALVGGSNFIFGNPAELFFQNLKSNRYSMECKKEERVNNAIMNYRYANKLFENVQRIAKENEARPEFNSKLFFDEPQTPFSDTDSDDSDFNENEQRMREWGALVCESKENTFASLWGETSERYIPSASKSQTQFISQTTHNTPVNPPPHIANSHPSTIHQTPKETGNVQVSVTPSPVAPTKRKRSQKPKSEDSSHTPTDTPQSSLAVWPLFRKINEIVASKGLDECSYNEIMEEVKNSLPLEMIILKGFTFDEFLRLALNFLMYVPPCCALPPIGNKGDKRRVHCPLKYNRESKKFYWVSQEADDKEYFDLMEMTFYFLTSRNDSKLRQRLNYNNYEFTNDTFWTQGQTVLSDFSESLVDKDGMKTQTKSSKTLVPTSKEERENYNRQEKLRYGNPHAPFTFTSLNGVKCIVAPCVRSKAISGKARDHFMLKPERPPFVSLLSVVRDAASRLPGAVGTRSDIVDLLLDSSYVIPDIKKAKVNTAVSGALDRLHAMGDPCVRFYTEQKLWVYLHHNRREDEFSEYGNKQVRRKKPRKKDGDDMFTESPLDEY